MSEIFKTLKRIPGVFRSKDSVELGQDQGELGGYSPLFSNDNRAKRVIGLIVDVLAVVGSFAAIIWLTLHFWRRHAMEFKEPTSIRPISFENATAIFNVINGVAGNKDQNLYPNGVTIMPAYIPEGTIIYHGNNHGEIPEGVGWTALDYEFSYSFIGHFAKGKGPGGPGGKGPDGSHGGKGPGGPGGPGGGGFGSNGIVPGGSKKPPAKDWLTMLSFEAVKPLDKVIFLDGATGRKGSGGFVDMQMILGDVPEGKTENEYTYAENVCKWGKPWGLDGIIRIEVGFELIICDFFSPKLRMIANTTMDWSDHLLGVPETEGEEEWNGTYKKEVDSILSGIGSMAGWDQAKMGNLHDHRDKRILIDYKGIVTPINKTWIDPNPFVRRTINISEELKEEIRVDFSNYMSKKVDPFTGTDWQFVTNEIVGKFSATLQLVHQYMEPMTSDQDDADFMKGIANITVLTGNFVRRFTDITLSKTPEEQILDAKKQAVYEYSHHHEKLYSDSEVLIWSSVTVVVEKVVDAMFELYDISREFIDTKYIKEQPIADLKPKFEEVKQRYTDFVLALDWSDFYDCTHKCGLDSICVTPFGGWNKGTDGSRMSKQLSCKSIPV